MIIIRNSHWLKYILFDFLLVYLSVSLVGGGVWLYACVMRGINALGWNAVPWCQDPGHFHHFPHMCTLWVGCTANTCVHVYTRGSTLHHVKGAMVSLIACGQMRMGRGLVCQGLTPGFLPSSCRPQSPQPG